MITIGVMVTVKYYRSVNCSAMAREWDLILPHSRQIHLARCGESVRLSRILRAFSLPRCFATIRRISARRPALEPIVVTIASGQTYFREQAVLAGVMVQTMH